MNEILKWFGTLQKAKAIVANKREELSSSLNEWGDLRNENHCFLLYRVISK